MTGGGALDNGRVTVVIPTYNRADRLPRAIESVLAQTAIDRCDVVVVDDGSVDDTPDVAARYADRLVYVRQSNGGPSVARNTAIRTCCNEFAAFLDDDDEWAPDKTERQLAAFDRWPAIVLVAGRAEVFRSDGSRWGHPVPAIPLDQPVDLAPRLFELNILPTLTVMVRTRTLLDVGLFHPGLRRSEDAHAWIRIACRGSGVYLDRLIATYSADQDGLSADVLRLMLGELHARYLLQRELDYRPDCRPSWYRGVASILVNLRDEAYRRGCYDVAARYALRSLLHRPWGRARWEWFRLIESLFRATVAPAPRRRARPASVARAESTTCVTLRAESAGADSSQNVHALPQFTPVG